LTSGSFIFLDANPGSRPIPDAINDQEIDQGVHEDTPNPKSVEGIINTPFILAQIP